ncbi:MAG: acyltransferase family protein [Bacteroidetes bacterium]|nr:acyltransferase family protein [Bacteroidota bacterium]
MPDTHDRSTAGNSASQAAPKNNLVWADRLRNLATVLVISIHVSGPIAHNTTDYDTWYWWSANLWDSFSRPSVPLFIMLSGFLLLGKDYPLMDFLQRRFSRILIPWLVWSVAYGIYNSIANHTPASMGEWFRFLMENKVHYHLWFLYLILGLYLVYPILRPWVRSAREQDFLYFFILCIIGAWGYKILDQFFNIKLGFYFELVSNEAGNFVLGYYLGQKFLATDPNGAIKPWAVSRRILWYISAGLIVVGGLATAVGTWWASLAYGHHFHAYFYDYLTPNVGIGAIGWFIFAQLSFGSERLFAFEQKFAEASFGIYFVHVFVLDWWSHSGYWAYKFHPAKCIPILIVMVCLMSFLVISFVRTLPGGKKIT